MKARLLSLALVLAVGGLLTGCGGEGTSDSASGSSAQSKAVAPAAGGALDSAAQSAVESNSGANPAAAAAGAVARLVRTADLTIEVPNVTAASAKVRTAAIALGGIVSAEVTGFPPDSESGKYHEDGSDAAPGSVQPQSVITLRVPEPQLDEALTKVSSFGRELSRNTSSKDVTANIADLDSRVSTQTRSVARIRDLMGKAKSLQDIVLLESELSKREADLESVQAQQRVLNDQADLSTITVTLRAAGAKAVAAKDNDGFLPGLRIGWHALAASTTAVLTVLGAVLPIAVVLVLIGVPVYLLYRRNRPGSSVSAPAAPPTPAATP